MTSFSQLKEALLAREQPNERDLGQMIKKAEMTLSLLGGLERIAFRHRDEFFDLFEALIREEYTPNTPVVVEQEPPKAGPEAIVLSDCIVGCAPGQYHVWIYWFQGNVCGCFAHVQTGNLRASKEDAEIAA